MTLEVCIQGLPVAKGRSKSSADVHRTPGRTRHWGRVASQALRQAALGARFPGRVALTVVVVWPRPIDRPVLIPVAEWRHAGRIFASSLADTDNVVKAVQDAANQAEVWVDDRRVCKLDAEAVYAAVGEPPCVEVVISDALPAPRRGLGRLAAPGARPSPSVDAPVLL